jgi:hypothetical protein
LEGIRWHGKIKESMGKIREAWERKGKHGKEKGSMGKIREAWEGIR